MNLDYLFAAFATGGVCFALAKSALPLYLTILLSRCVVTELFVSGYQEGGVFVVQAVVLCWWEEYCRTEAQ